MKQKKLTAREKKLLSRPKIRVISVAEGIDNRSERRFAKRMRTSSTLCTKKWTPGRIEPRRRMLKAQMMLTPSSHASRGPMSRLIQAFNRRLGITK